MSAGFGRLLDSLVGHTNITNILLARAQQQELPNCLLLTGEAGLGKAQLALGIAQELWCKEKKSGQACGYCPDCVRTAKRAHENLLFIDTDGSSQFKLEQARDLQSFLQLQSDGRPRVLILNAAERMNSSAANALLKTLEEPPADTHIFLLSQRPEQILATIRSRAQTYALKPLRLQELRERTKAEEWQIQASGGSYGALKQWRDSERLALRQQFIDSMAQLKNLDFADLQELTAGIAKDKGDFLAFLRFLQMWWSDVLRYQVAPQHIRFFPDAKELLQHFARGESEKLFALQENCFSIEQDTNINIDRSLHLESLLLKMQSVL